MGGSRVRYSTAVDMYAFGVMLAELLTWARAYAGLHVTSVFSLRDQVVNHGLRPDLPEHIRNASTTTKAIGKGSTLDALWLL